MSGVPFCPRGVRQSSVSENSQESPVFRLPSDNISVLLVERGHKIFPFHFLMRFHHRVAQFGLNLRKYEVHIQARGGAACLPVGRSPILF